jgi:hypothetical protein
MNQLKSFAEKNGFKADKLQVWGNYKGYQITIGRYRQDNILTVFTAVSFVTPEDEQKLSSMLAGMAAAKLIKDFKTNHGSISITKTKAIGQIPAEELEYLLDKLTGLFSELGAKPACFNCKNEGLKEFASYNKVNLPMCEDCYSSISQNLYRAELEHDSTSSNYLSGTIGAILGALLGSVIWILIGMLGYIASIAGFAISAASVKGYMMMKGKITRATPWIVGLASLAALLLAQFLTLDIVFFREVSKTGYQLSLADALKTTFKLPFFSPEVTVGFIKDTLLGLLFAALGAYSIFRRLTTTANAPAGTLERV